MLVQPFFADLVLRTRYALPRFGAAGTRTKLREKGVLDAAPAMVHEQGTVGPYLKARSSDETAWYWVLSPGALIFTSTFVVMGVVIGFDETAPHEYVELLQALP